MDPEKLLRFLQMRRQIPQFQGGDLFSKELKEMQEFRNIKMKYFRRISFRNPIMGTMMKIPQSWFWFLRSKTPNDEEQFKENLINLFLEESTKDENSFIIIEDNERNTVYKIPLYQFNNLINVPGDMKQIIENARKLNGPDKSFEEKEKMINREVYSLKIILIYQQFMENLKMLDDPLNLKQEVFSVLEDYYEKKAIYPEEPFPNNLDINKDESCLNKPKRYRPKTKIPVRENDIPVGLKNEGSTCAVNALLQTLYLNPKFYQIIMSTKIPMYNVISKQIIKNKVPIKQQKLHSINLVYYLQKLFGQMTLSYKKYVPSALNIQQSIFSQDGKQIFQEYIQHDVAEVYNKLLEYVEQGIKTLEQLFPKTIPLRVENQNQMIMIYNKLIEEGQLPELALEKSQSTFQQKTRKPKKEKEMLFQKIEQKDDDNEEQKEEEEENLPEMVLERSLSTQPQKQLQSVIEDKNNIEEEKQQISQNLFAKKSQPTQVINDEEQKISEVIIENKNKNGKQQKSNKKRFLQRGKTLDDDKNITEIKDIKRQMSIEEQTSNNVMKQFEGIWKKEIIFKDQNQKIQIRSHDVPFSSNEINLEIRFQDLKKALKKYLYQKDIEDFKPYEDQDFTTTCDINYYIKESPEVLRFDLKRMEQYGFLNKNEFIFPQQFYIDRFKYENKDRINIENEQENLLQSQIKNLQNRLKKFENFGENNIDIIQSFQDQLDYLQNIDLDYGKDITESDKKVQIERLEKVINQLLSKKKIIKNQLDETKKKLESCQKQPEELQKVSYKLTSIIKHIGQDNSGHYVAYIHDFVRDTWWYFNDDTVKQVENIEEEYKDCLRNAYVIQYMKEEAINEYYKIDNDNLKMRFHFKSRYYKDMDMPSSYYIDQIDDKLKKEITKINKKYVKDLEKKEEIDEEDEDKDGLQIQCNQQ